MLTVGIRFEGVGHSSRLGQDLTAKSLERHSNATRTGKNLTAGRDRAPVRFLIMQREIPRRTVRTAAMLALAAVTTIGGASVAAATAVSPAAELRTPPPPPAEAMPPLPRG